MASVDVEDGDTWDSIASANVVPLTSLLMANGIDPNSCPDAPPAGSCVQLPDDPPEVCVAPGHDHSLDSIPDESTVWIRLDLSPDEAAAETGSLRLYSADGSHDVTLSIADRCVPSGDTVDVLFDTIDPTGTYSLDYVSARGRATPVVCEKTFDELDDSSSSSAAGPDSSSDGDAEADPDSSPDSEPYPSYLA